MRNSTSDQPLSNEWTGNQGAGIGSLYEVRVTRSSGDTLSTGEANLGTWLAITTGRTFEVSQSGVGVSQAVLSCTVRRTDLSASDSGTITIRAEVEDLQ